MNAITEVHGTRVDCHVCKISHPANSEPEAHAWAQGHAESHMTRPAVHLQLAPAAAPAFPRHAKTSINHGRWIMLDIVTLGFAIPFHFMAWLAGGRKTTFR